MSGGAPVLIVGNPNVGKSSLFNALTGARQHTVNAPGTTVELVRGTWKTARGSLDVIDLPGTYSLIAQSPDEQVAAETIRGAEPGSVAVVVVDATSPSRSLYLLAQVAEEGIAVVVALTMNDLAAEHGHRVDPVALAGVLGIPVVEVNAHRHKGADDLAEAIDVAATRQAVPTGLPLRTATGTTRSGGGLDETERLFDWVAGVVAEVDSAPRARRTASDPVDRILLSPWTGIPIFLGVAWGLLELTARATAPLVNWVTEFFSGPVSSGTSHVLDWMGVGGGWLEGLFVDGVLVGVGTVASFVPVLAVVFVALGVLEASGYMSRVAVVADRAMAPMGLDGRAVLPLMVGFGCSVPALTATRILPNSRQRLLTGLVVPYISCSARLAVYIMLAQIFFPDHAGTVVFLLNAMSVVLVVGVGVLLRSTILRDVCREPLAIVLPAYQRPRFGILLRSTATRVGEFVHGAGLIIVTVLVALWLAAATPVRGGHGFGDVPAEDSLYGVGAQTVAPALEPMGLGDWHLAASLVSGLAAKEATVAALNQAYTVDDSGDVVAGDVSERIRETVTETSGGHPEAAAFAFMVLILAYVPCLATVAEQKRQFGWRWTGIAVGLHLVIGWVLATAVFQLGRLL